MTESSGKDHQIGPAAGRLARYGNHAIDVAREIADRGIDLPQRNFSWRIL